MARFTPFVLLCCLFTCARSGGNRDSRCDSDADCAGNERCDANGECAPGGDCLSDGDCEGSLRCGILGHCLQTTACDVNADCPSAYACDDGKCSAGGSACEGNEPATCPEGQLCSVDQVCIDQGSCTEDRDCAPQHTCSRNFLCEPAKPCSAGCAAGERCSFSGGCIPAERCAVNNDCSTVQPAEICDATYTCAPGEHCGHLRFSPERNRSNLLIVIDSSGSMSSSWNGGPSRWAMATDTISDVVDMYHDFVNFGLMAFPGGTDVEQLCTPGELLLPVGAANPTTIRAAMGTREPHGGTPTRASLQQILDNPAAFGLADPDSVNAILLITDGSANCDSCAWCVSPEDQEAVNPVIRRLGELDPPISTYVVGFQMFWEDTNHSLNCHAQAGGTAKGGCVRAIDCHVSDDPCYRRIDYQYGVPDYGAAAMTSALSSIIWTASSCTFALPRDPPSVNDMWLYGDDGTSMWPVPRDNWRNDGWDYSPEGRVLSVFGSSCDPFSERRADLVVIMGCSKPR